MAHKVVTITHPDGTKKVIVGQPINSQPVSSDTSKPVSTRESEEEKRKIKPTVTKAGLTKERNPYKNGGKFKFKQKDK